MSKNIEKKFLTFILDHQEYGLDIINIIEIIGITEITPLPKAPGYIKGVINLRSKIIPVMDFRLKLGLTSVPYDSMTCIIVTETKINDKVFCIGLIVDSVSEVISIKPEKLEPTPNFSSNFQSNLIIGMAKIKNKVKTILDIHKILEVELSHPSGYIQSPGK